jgi:PHD/YefM family antitoxin component YafN of YafNO toxin-antitoxin module
MRRIPVENKELVTVRDAMRGLNTMVTQLNDGREEKFVLTKHGKMVGVVLSADMYAKLIEEAGWPTP